MNKLFSAIFLSLVSSVFARAQSSSDYKKGEFFVGYSSASYVDDEAASHIIARGFNASGVYNFRRYVGIKGDVSATFGRTENVRYTPFFDNPTAAEVSYKTNDSIYNFVGGIQIKDNSPETRFKPFAHAMAGAGQYKVRVRNVNCSTPDNCSLIPVSETNTGFALVLGGGLDIKVNDKIDVRVVQVDINTISYKETASRSTGIGTFRFGAGIVFK